MHATVFYFSGTGNSLSAARHICGLLEMPADLISIPSLAGNAKVEVRSDIVGFVFPVYFMSVPQSVRMFISRLAASCGNPYVFAVATCNGGPGHAVLTLRRLLKRKGYTLAAGYAVTMPGNSVIILDMMNPPEVQERRLMDSEEKLKRIADGINRRVSGVYEGTGDLVHYAEGLATKTAIAFYRTPRRFHLTDRCTKCGQCVRICPHRNIRMGDVGPVWKNRCENCLACFHWCPNHAVELGKNTVGKMRYHNPEIDIFSMYVH